ncbi:MAG: hypothetical protein AB7P67_11285, partial [Vicinamibacterales bacterium]
MRHRIVRPVVLTLLILTGIASAGFLWFGGQRIASTHNQTDVAGARVDALVTGMADLSAALQAYVAPGQSVSTWAERATALLAQLGDDLGAFERLPDATATAEMVRPAVDSLARINDRVREYLRSGDDLMAADLAFNEARDATGAAVAALRDWRARQQGVAAAAVAGIERQQTAALGVMVLAWALSLLLAWKRPAPASVEAAADVPAATGLAADILNLSLAPADGPGVDLQAAAQACDALARASDGAALKAALGHGAAALGAKGVVVWLGVDEQLFAVASHGYDERHLRRPIPRTAGNVTAETWRTGQAVSIAGDADAPGVVVVPMADANGCRGVVSAELLPGRVAAADRQALLSMFAAQLGGIVGASA